MTVTVTIFQRPKPPYTGELWHDVALYMAGVPLEMEQLDPPIVEVLDVD